MAVKPSIPKGTRDFSPQEVSKRKYLMQTIGKHFERFGYHPIETPSFENSETLLGKYGEEGDRLIFKILNSGEKVKKADVQALEQGNFTRFSNSLSEKSLRYDLTVPFARYVVQHQNEIVFPFKRYQMQLVWRADNPQKGRYREFCQCDADVVGSKSLWQEVELIQLYDNVFTDLNLQGITIQINNRKILTGIAQMIGASDKLTDFTVALDKLDKIGQEGVINEMIGKNISEQAVEKLKPLFSLSGSFDQKLNDLEKLLQNSSEGLKGIEELRFINNAIKSIGLKSATLNLQLTLARGLDYYTGAIFEISAPESIKMGSIGGGGRYDDLTSIFGLKNVSGVGISFGLDRIYLALEALDLFPKTVSQSSKVLFLNYGDNEVMYLQNYISKLREAGVKVQLYPENAKIAKQFQYATKKDIPFAVLVGQTEMENKTFILKDLNQSTQETLTFEELLDKLK